MGRPKLILKPIPNGRDRDLALTKRKKGLMSKISEFSDVCGVKACMIMYDGNGSDAPPLTWPQDPIEVNSIIERYESIKNEKLPKKFDLNNFFEIRKNMVDIEISKVQKETLKIKFPTWHASFNNLGVEDLRSFIDMLDMKLEACNQRVEMSKHNNNNFNLMQKISQSQFSLNDGNHLVAPYLLNHLDHKGSSSHQSQQQMLSFDPNLMQLMIAKSNGMVDDISTTNQVVDVPMDFANLGNSTNHQFDESLDYFSQLDQIEDLASSQLDEKVNWTNQQQHHGVVVIGAMNGAITNYDNARFCGDDEHNHQLEASLCNYNNGALVQPMQQPFNYDAAILQNNTASSQSKMNVQQMDELQTDHHYNNNNKLQNELSNHFI